MVSLLSTAVGIAAVAVTLALGAGAEREFQRALESMGGRLLVVNAGLRPPSPVRGPAVPFETLAVDDGWAMEELGTLVERVAPVANRGMVVRFRRDTLSATVLGSTEDLQWTHAYSVLAGRFIDAHDVRSHRRVAVIGADVVDQLFAGEWPLGERLQIGGVPFTIVGILRPKGAAADGSNQDDRVIVPLTAAQRRLFNAEHLDRIFVRAVSAAAVPQTEQQLTSLLRQRHGSRWHRRSPSGEPIDEFVIQDQDAIAAARRAADEGWFFLVAGIALSTLALSGGGVFALSMLAVGQRRVEIGLRRAVGARRRDILGQFLAETLCTGMIGGCVGVTLAGIGIVLGEALSGWPLVLSWPSVVLPLAVAIAMATLCGLGPALRAAKIDPIVALAGR